MTSVAQAIEAIGIGERDGEDVVLTVIAADGKVINHLLPEIADDDVTEFPSLYATSGTFKPGTVTAREGRTRDNVARVLWVPLDCDLLDWLQTPKDKATLDRAKADLWASSDEALEAMLAAQRADIERVIAQVGFPIHRLDVTGYGHCAYLRIADDDQCRVDDAGAAAKHLIGAINSVAGYQLADPQASDPGPRITRVPGSYNCKGATPRLVRTLYQIDGAVPLGTKPINRQSVATPVQIPDVGRGLDQAGCDAIVRAVAPLWGPGARNGIAFGLGGMMAKVKMPESQAVAIVTALAAGDDELADRLSAVRRSYARVRSGRETAGFTWLRDVLAEDALVEVDRVLGVLRPRIVLKAAGKRSRQTDPADQEAHDAQRDHSIAEAFPPCPDIAFYGWFGRYRDLMAPTTEAPDAFHLAAALTLAGAMIGRRVRSYYASDAIFANLYTVLIGASGSSRKDTAIKRATGLPFEPADVRRTVYPSFGIFRDVSSGEGLVKTLKDSPNGNALLYLTEIMTMMTNARRKGTATILDRLIEAWDTPAKLENLNKLSPVTVTEPYLSIVAATQPIRLARAMTDEDIHSGFANRWLYVIGSGKEPMSRPPAVDRRAAYRLYLEMHDAITAHQDGAVLPWDAGANDEWDRWYLTLVAGSGVNEDEDAMRVRHPSLAQKIALIYAVSDKAKAIGARHVSAAIALIEWSWSVVRELLKEWGTGTNQVIEERILGCVERNGPLKRRDIQMLTRNKRWGARDFAQVFEAMTRNGTLAQDEEGRHGFPSG